MSYDFAIFGADNRMVVPLIEVSTNGPPILQIGPGTTRWPFRWFLRMPDLEECERIPCPMAYDRSSIRFEPEVVYSDQQIPEYAHFEIHKIILGDEIVRTKSKFHSWERSIDTGGHPSLKVGMASMAPGSTMEFIGTTYWKQPQKSEVWQNRMPTERTRIGISLLMRLKPSWLPKPEKRKKIEFFRGSTAEKPMDPVSVTPPIQGHGEGLRKTEEPRTKTE